MKVDELQLSGLKLITLDVFRDERGFFVERFHEPRFQQLGLPTRFVQVNHSRSAPGVLRGFHYQHSPSQGKLMGVTRGKIWDVGLDLRLESATYGQSFGIELSAESGHMLWIPPGFAHGFCVLGDEPADVLYQVTAPYNPKTEGGIRWNDPELGVSWPIQNPVVSARDQKLSTFAEYKKNPIKNWD